MDRDEFMKKFDVVLNMDDPNFAEDLMKAIGVEPGQSVEFIGPQFTRTDGLAVTYIPKTTEEYLALPKMKPENLKKIGCQVWDVAGGKPHWLYPREWYEHIPAGHQILDINGNVESFEPGKTDNDIRFGALAYGFLGELPIEEEPSGDDTATAPGTPPA